MPVSASELHRRGVEAANARRFAEARRVLTAAARIDDPDLRARIDGTLAYVLAQTGEPAAAERLTREALARPGLSRPTTAVLSGQLGTLLMHAGRIDESATLLTRAIDTIDDQISELANLLMNRSVARMQQHDLSACTADLERAIGIYEALGETGPLAEAQHNLGYAALLGGDLVTALALMTRSRPVFAETSALATAISDLDRAEVLRDAGLITEAESLLAEVAAQFGAQRMRQARGEAEFHLARSQLRHDPASAARTARIAARRFAALGSDSWAARAEAVRLEAALRAPGPTPTLVEFEAVAEALQRAGFRTEARTLRTSAALIGGRIPPVAADAPTPLRVRAWTVRAQRAARAGRRSEALRAAASGIDLISDWQQSFGALDLQSSAAMMGTELMLTGLAAAAQTTDASVLFEWSERARHVSQQVSPLRPPHDPELADDLAALRLLRVELAGSDWMNDARVRALRDRVRERQWSATGARGRHERVGLAETIAHLDADTAVLSYVYTGSGLQVVVTTASGAEIIVLDWAAVAPALDGLRADLDVAALTRGGPMAGVTERSLTARLGVLDAALVAPARRAAPHARRFAIAAPGILAGLPWSMLPSLRGVPNTLATSISRWVVDRATPLRAPSSIGIAAGPRVPRAVEEIQRAREAWPTSVTLEGPDAAVDAVTRLAADVDLLHIAAHGRHAVDNPLFSGFELADGVLFGYDVDLVPTPPDAVILSACELGRSSVHWGEESLGMTRVWLHAGSRSVIAAPVSVPDDVACDLLAAAHGALAQGSSPAEALSAASVDTGLIAPFQCHGSGF